VGRYDEKQRRARQPKLIKSAPELRNLTHDSLVITVLEIEQAAVHRWFEFGVRGAVDPVGMDGRRQYATLGESPRRTPRRSV
jgi:hypothetical protein